jgi:hypothetical integral membrane protein (TIGR02206 family)
MVYLARRSFGETLKTTLAKVFGYSLFLNYFAYVIYRITWGYWEMRYDLPMELCNWSGFVTSIALITRNRFFAELSYFWVMTGSINAVITPDLDVDFPHLYFFIFFIGHAGLIIACCYAVFGLRLYPRKGAVARVFGISQIYLIAAFLIDLAVGGNYGYLMKKPIAGSFMDYLGDWPYYILNLQIVSLFLFMIAYLPFYFRNSNEARRIIGAKY